MVPEKDGDLEDGGNTLTEDCVLQASRQYDVQMVYQVKLSARGLRALGDGFASCRALTHVDISRNRLRSLEGIDVLAGSLMHMNAAENELETVVGVDRCLLLEELLLEGNKLSDEVALGPLAELPNLRCLYLQREVPVSNNTMEKLLLDNPICRDKEVYEKIIQRRFSAVLCVDGRCFRNPSPKDVAAEISSSLLPSSTLLLAGEESKPAVVDIKDDLDDRIFANAIAECNAACRRALLF